MRWRRATWLGVAVLLCVASPAGAGVVLYDVADRQVLEASDADAVVDAGRVADLLLVAVVCERLHAGAFTATTRVPVLVVDGDRERHPPADQPVEVRELLQLLLLSDSRTAAKTLAWAAGPGLDRARERMHEVAKRLRLRHTAVPDDWPTAVAPSVATSPLRRGGTTARELARLALAVTSEPDIRRRLALDGVPIADGSVIARASAPLIVLNPGPSKATTTAGPRIAVAERDGLTLLAVATGPVPETDLSAVMTRGFDRYRRVEVVREGQPIGPMVRVRGGIIPTFNAVAAEALAMTTRVTDPAKLAFRLQLPSEVQAPVEVRQPIGELVVEREGEVLAVVPLVAPKAIAPSGWLDTARRSTNR
jgi:D-alanyl-D-alanine carboxypeptidase